MPAKLQPDTLVALYILKKYGEKAFPGIAAAPVEFTMVAPGPADELERQGVLLLDFGGGKFDHHRQDRWSEKDCVTTLVAKYLEVRHQPELRKLIAYAKRDDLEGQGTRSRDPIDRALGLSGIITNLVRYYKDNPKEVIKIVFKILEAVWQEEYNRHHLYPQLFKRLVQEKKVDYFKVITDKGKEIKVIMIESDEAGLVGFLRAWSYIAAQVVVQKLSSGHINIITKQQDKLRLHGVVELLRLQEAEKKGIEVPEEKLTARGKIEEVPEWFYDVAALSIQNGGLIPGEIPPTKLTLAEVKQAVVHGLKIYN